MILYWTSGDRAIGSSPFCFTSLEPRHAHRSGTCVSHLSLPEHKGIEFLDLPVAHTLISESPTDGS